MKKSKLISMIILVCIIIIFVLAGLFYRTQIKTFFSNLSTEVVEKAEPVDTNEPNEPNVPAEPNDPNDPNAPNEPNEPKDPKVPKDPNDPNAPDLEAINLNNVEMKQIIATIAEWTDKPVIPYDDKIMSQKITIYSPKELPRAQALSLIYVALRSKGYIAEETETAIYIKPLAEAKFGSIPTIGADVPLARIEDKTKIVEKFFSVKNYDPVKLQEIITPLIAEYGHVTADESTGTIVVIDTVENLFRIERIIHQLDVPEYEQTVTETFEIKSGDPTEIVQLLELMLDKDERRRRRSEPSAKPDKGPAGATSVVVTLTKVPVILIPDARRKWIIAKGSAEDIKEISDWIEKLDRPEPITAEQTVVQVRYVDAREVANIVNRTLQEMPGAKLKANVVVQPLPQAKQIIVFGNAENRKMVENLIAEIDLPSEDIFEQETFTLKYADPDQIKENIEELFSDINEDIPWWQRRWQDSRGEDTVRVISYPTFGRVTVIASPANMAKIKAQIEEWDVPLDVEKDQYRILSLKNSDPVQLVDLLTKLFTEETSSDARRPWWWGGGDDESKKKIIGSLYGMLTFEAVPDTKKIIIISKIPEAYDVVEKLVLELDSQEAAEVPRVITLKYADAEDLCDQLNAILNEPGTEATIHRSKRGLSDRNSDDGSKNKNQTGTPSDSASTQPEIIKPWWTSGVARTSAEDEAPASNLIGKIRFIPVHRSKAILVLAPPEYMDDIKLMIETLDQPGKQVMIKVIIVEVNHSSMTSIGVELATNPAAFGTLGENAIQALTAMASAETLGNWTISNTVNVYSLIDFLIKNVDAKVLNQPTLWTKDNEEAEFFKGQNVAFVENVKTSTEGLATSEQVEYRNVGVTLRVRPNITPEKAVDVTINLIISQVEEELINSKIATNELNTTTHVIVEDGETIMLGGILFQNDTTIERKVPLLGDIPVAGGLFRHESSSVTNNELLAFITPYVVDEGGAAADANEMPFAESIEKMQTIKEWMREKIEISEQE